MTMELLENGCLKVLLTSEDLAEWGLSFEQLDYQNIVTRQAIQRLLAFAQQQTGFRPGGDVTIEAVPVEGGCLLLLTPAFARRKLRMRRAVGPYVYHIEDEESLFRIAERWNALPQAAFVGSSLYAAGDGYDLVLYPASTLPQGMQALLAEFSRPAGEGDALAAYAAEHGRPLAVGNALRRIGLALAHAK